MSLADKDFIHYFNYVSSVVNSVANKKGWWKKERNESELIMLIVCECAEAVEGLRHNNPPSDHIPKFSLVEEEMADVIIRIMDYSIAKNYRVAEAIIEKIKFNKKREYKHGGKKF